MSKFIKWKRPLYLALAAGIISLSTYGIYHTAQAYTEIRETQTTGDTLTIDAASAEGSPVPGGPLCNPEGCAGCSGCVSLQYQENLETLPGSTIQLEQIN